MFHLPVLEQNKNFPQKTGSVSCVYGILIHATIQKKVMSKSRENSVTDGRTDKTEFIAPSDMNIYHKRQKHEQNSKV